MRKKKKIPPLIRQAKMPKKEWNVHSIMSTQARRAHFDEENRNI